MQRRLLFAVRRGTHDLSNGIGGDNSRMFKRLAKPTVAVDLPTPVAPAMSNKRGGRVAMACAALWDNPMR